jgi:hypothetical protein
MIVRIYRLKWSIVRENSQFPNLFSAALIGKPIFPIKFRRDKFGKPFFQCSFLET